MSEFLGSRLVLIGFVFGALGLGFMVFTGIKLWLVLTRGTMGTDAVLLVVGACLAWALLSVGGSARRAGFTYLSGERAVSRDVARFVGRRLQRRLRARRK